MSTRVNTAFGETRNTAHTKICVELSYTFWVIIFSKYSLAYSSTFLLCGINLEILGLCNEIGSSSHLRIFQSCICFSTPKLSKFIALQNLTMSFSLHCSVLQYSTKPLDSRKAEGIGSRDDICRHFAPFLLLYCLSAYCCRWKIGLVVNVNCPLITSTNKVLSNQTFLSLISFN